MGVKSLWELLEPVGRPTPLETLESKRLAIDSSIWLYQFQATMRDKSSGRALVNAHVLGFLRRISKLLFFGIKPVFVFDGGAPELKRKTIGNRKHKKEGARLSAKEVAERLLAAQLRKEAVEVAAGGKGKGGERSARIDEDTVYLEDLTGPSAGLSLPPTTPAQSPTKSSEQPKSIDKKAQWRDHDLYRLPEVDLAARITARTSMAVPDPRLATEDELRDFIEQLDPDSLDVASPAFRELPTEVQYEIIGDLRLKSRQTSHKRLQGMLKASRTPLDFSKEQIRGLKQRNELTQQLLATTDSIGQAHVLIPVRIASERNREYVLVRSEGAEGGWVLGVRDGPGNTADKPIIIDDADVKSSVRGEGDAGREEIEIPGAGAAMDPDLRSFQQSMALAGIGKRQQNPSYSKVVTAPLRKRASHPASTAQPLKKPTADAGQVGPSQKKVPLFELSDSEKEDEDALPAPLSHGYEIDEEEDPELAAALQLSLDDAVVARRSGLRAHFESIVSVENEVEDDEDEDMEEVFVPNRLATALSIANAGPYQSPLKRPSTSPVKRPPDSPLRTPSGSRTVSGSRRVSGGGTMRTPPGAAPDTPSQKPSTQLSFPPKPSTTDAPVGALATKTTSSHSPTSSRLPSRPQVEQEDHGLGASTLFAGRLSTAFSSSAPVPLPSLPSTSAPTSVEAGDEDEDEDEDEDMDMEEVVVPVASGPDPSQGPAVQSGIEDDSIESLYADDVQTIPSLAAPLSEGVSGLSGDEAIVSPALDIAGSVAPEPGDMVEVDDDVEEIAVPSPPPASAPTPRPVFRQVNAEAGPSRRSRSPIPIRAPSPALSEDSDVIPGWSRSPSPAARAAGKAPREDHFDAAAEMDPRAEEGGFADFLSQIKGRDLATVRAEIDEEIKELRGQRKNALRDSEDVGGQNMVAQIMVMLRLFGIPYITAPMEAEAQCAELARLGLVDGIITDDSDVFLFGANRVYKDMFNQSKTVRVFLQSDLERELTLDRDALIRLAYLLGSDYTEGLQGVGPVVAMELLREFPGPDGLWRFREWWSRVQSGKDTEEDNGTPFKRRFKKRFKSLYLDSTWPPTNVRDAYLHPNVDDSEEPFQWGVPDLAGLRTLLSSELGWSETKIDDLIVPIIQKMTRREADTRANRQGNLGEWVDVQGEGATTRRAQKYKSKRLMQVVNGMRRDLRGKSVTPLGGEEDEDPTPKRRKGKKKADASTSSDSAAVDQGGRARGRGRGRGRGKGRGGASGGKRKRAETSEESISGSEFEPAAAPVEAVQRSRPKPRAVRRKVVQPVEDEVPAVEDTEDVE